MPLNKSTKFSNNCTSKNNQTPFRILPSNNFIASCNPFIFMYINIYHKDCRGLEGIRHLGWTSWTRYSPMKSCREVCSAVKHFQNAQVAAKLGICVKNAVKHSRQGSAATAQCAAKHIVHIVLWSTCAEKHSAGKHNVLWSTMCCKAQCCKAPFMSQNIYLFLVKTDTNVNPFWVAWTRQFVKVWEVPSSMRETLGELLIGSQWPSALLGGSGLQWTLPSLSPWVATNLNSPGYGGMNQASSILSREGELKASRKRGLHNPLSFEHAMHSMISNPPILWYTNACMHM